MFNKVGNDCIKRESFGPDLAGLLFLVNAKCMISPGSPASICL